MTSPSIDLTPYIGRGFPGDIDRAIAEVPVRGIDREQTQGMVRLCAETEPVLYEGDYSPRRVHYRPGSRPRLEAIAAEFAGLPPREAVREIARWVARTVRHPHLVGPTPADRALTEEQLIDAGVGWCNEQTRVFIALCEVIGVPARLCFVTHANLRCGHTCAEAHIEDRWAFVDVTFDIMVELPGGQLAEGRDLAGGFRELGHAAYRPALEAYFGRCLPFVEKFPGWNSTDRPSLESPGDLVAILGICNYIIDGVEPV